MAVETEPDPAPPRGRRIVVFTCSGGSSNLGADRADEVGEMSRAFSSMTKSLFKRIEASEKFAADVAHELKNPLTAARSTAESMTYARTDERHEERKLMEHTAEQRSLRDFGRK